jgi:hypothetical protein
VNPLKRLTATQALGHPWLHQNERQLSMSNLDQTVEELKKFQAQRRLKAGINAVKAANKLMKIISSLSNIKAAIAQEEKEHSLEARYELGDVIGEGGYAVVKAGVSKIDQRHVAIKVMNRGKIDPETEVSIRNEVSVLQSLNHPNIVKAYELFEEPEHFYFVLEKVSGGELFDRIVQKTVYTEAEARELAKVLLGAIKYCHDHHIVHR